VNPRQKSVLLVGILLIGLAALFPPWNLVDQYWPYSRDVERFAGYSFLFAPPAPLPPTRDTRVTATVSRIDSRRLAVEWVTIVLVVTGLLLLFRCQAVSPQRPEGPPTGPNAATSKATGSVATQLDANSSTGPPRSTANSSGDRASAERIRETGRRAREGPLFRGTAAPLQAELVANLRQNPPLAAKPKESAKL